MHNNSIIHPSERFYVVTFGGKTFHCERVTNIIEETNPTPEYLQKWMVNCAVDELILDGNRTISINDNTVRLLKSLAWNAHKKVSRQALAIGTNVHAMISGDTQAETEEAKACFRGYQEFVKEFVPVVIGSEIKVYDTKNLIAGTIDWIGLKGTDKAKKKTLYILDWKSSAAISRNYLIQIVVYKWMLTSFIKTYLKNPTQYSLEVQKIMNDIISACGRNPKIKCAVIRLNKKLKARILKEVHEVTPKEEKVLLDEFKLMLKLHNKRKENEHGHVNGR